MAKKVLSAILTLKDKDFSANMKKASQGVKGFDKQMKYAGNQVKKFKDNAVSSFSSVAKSAAGIAAAYVGLKSLNNFKNEAVELAKAQIDAETKLAAVMKNTKGVTDKHIQSVKSYASEVQNMGVIGDEVQLSGVQQLATFQLQGETLKKLMPGMADLIAQQKGLGATQQDAVNIGNMFGKVMNGQVGALSRAGINFTKAQEEVLKFGSESQKAATLAEVLKMNVGGVNKAMAETDQGKIQQMQNAWGDYKEEIGKKILPLQAQFAGWFYKQIPKIQGFMLGAIDKGVNAFNKVKGMGTTAFESIKRAIQDNKPTIDKIRNGIGSLGTIAVTAKDWAVDAFKNIKASIDDNKPTIDGVRGVMEDLGQKALSLKDWLISAFQSGQPALTWLKDVGLPGMVDGISGVIDMATGMYNFINDNWGAIEPVVYGIGGAILFYKGAMTAATIATTIWSGVTKGLAFAQGALSAVLAMSPLGWIAIAIGAVVAVGVLLYKNWDTIKEKTGQLWQRLLDNPLLALAAGPFGAIVAAGILIYKNFDTIKEKARAFFGAIGGWVKSALEKWESFKSAITNFKMPKWVSTVGKTLGSVTSKVGGFLNGSHATGLNRVPFNGYVAELHKDEMIVPARQSEKLRQQGISIDNIDQVTGQSTGPVAQTAAMTTTTSSNKEVNVYLTVNAKGVTVAEVVSEMVPKLKQALANM